MIQKYSKMKKNKIQYSAEDKLYNSIMNTAYPASALAAIRALCKLNAITTLEFDTIKHRIESKKMEKKYYRLTFAVVCDTNGKGLWTEKSRPVKVNKLELVKYDEFESGELRAYFTKSSWDVEKHGLIYTDKQFVKDLQAALKDTGLNGLVEYSEQGMQGDTFVSFDTDAKFTKAFIAAAGKPHDDSAGKEWWDKQGGQLNGPPIKKAV